MKKLEIPKWKDKNRYEKILTIMGIILAITIIILALIEFLGKYETINIFEPLLGILLFIQGLQYYKYDRNTAIISFIASFIILMCGIIMIFI